MTKSLQKLAGVFFVIDFQGENMGTLLENSAWQEGRSPPKHLSKF